MIGPPADRAFDADGKPLGPAIGFAKGRGVDVAALEVIDTPRGRSVAATVTNPGQQAGEVLGRVVPQIILSVPFRKTMRWGSESVWSSASPASYASGTAWNG